VKTSLQQSLHADIPSTGAILVRDRLLALMLAIAHALGMWAMSTLVKLSGAVGTMSKGIRSTTPTKALSSTSRSSSTASTILTTETPTEIFFLFAVCSVAFAAMKVMPRFAAGQGMEGAADRVI